MISEHNMIQMKSLKLKSYSGENVKYFRAVILVNCDNLDSTGAFKTDNIGYINCIFEYTYDYILRLW